MNILSTTIDIWDANRDRTLATVDAIEKFADPQAILGWRPGVERAHIAWQLMHIGITEEVFATERLSEEKPDFADLVPRFKGGSVPDDDIPSLSEIRDVLSHSREHLKQTISQFNDDQLDLVPDPLKERGWSIGKVLKVLTWHEPHHQGQAHITLNLWKAMQ